MGKIYGYARVSSREQNLDRQLTELRKYVIEENIIADKQSGKDLDRPGYNALKGSLGLRAGDTLYITSLDRLSRNKADIKHELKWFQENKIQIRVLNLPTTMADFGEGKEWIQDMVTNIIIEVMASIAEQERMMIRQRQKEGIEAARLSGKPMGRPQKGYPEKWEFYYIKYKNGEVTRRFVLQQLFITDDRFSYLKRKYESEHKKEVKR